MAASAEQGIRTPQAARAERARRTQERAAVPASAQPAAQPSSAAPRPSKEVGAHRFGQRAYTDEDLESLYTDLDDLDP